MDEFIDGEKQKHNISNSRNNSESIKDNAKKKSVSLTHNNEQTNSGLWTTSKFKEFLKTAAVLRTLYNFPQKV